MSHSVVGDRWMFIRRRSWEQQSAKVCYQHFACDSRKFCDWIYCSDKRFVMINFVAVYDWMTCQLCVVSQYEDELRLIQLRRNLASHRPLHKPHWTGLFTHTTYRPTGFKQADSVSKVNCICSPSCRLLLTHIERLLPRSEENVLLQFLNTSFNLLFRSSLHKVKSLIVLIWWLSRLKFAVEF